MIVAILSTTVLPLDGTYRVGTIPFPASLAGIPHYIGHPATKALIEALGAVPAPTKLFAGQEVGEVVLAVPLAANARDGGWTLDQAVSDISALKARLVIRLE